MRMGLRGLVLWVVLAVPLLAAAQMQAGQYANAPDLPAEAEQLFALANQARAAAGVGRLNWDPALAQAALNHCRLMAANGPISHQYPGEPDAEARAAQAGAHFSLMEENVAIGPDAPAIHDEWMHSEGHRENLLNPNVDRLGVAVVQARGVLYAVEDFSRAVPQLSRDQVEIVIGRLVGVSGVTVLADDAAARAYCAGIAPPRGARQPSFLMKWQDADLQQLPRPLVDRLSSGRYHQAEVGSCAPQGAQAGFTVYRVAVLLY